MSLKPVHAVALIVVIILIGIALYFKFGSREIYTNTLTGGQVISVNADSIVVSGRIISSDGKHSVKDNFEFKITPKTVFKNKAIIITQAEMQSGKQFTPKTQEIVGKFADFRSSSTLVLNKITSKENLFRFSDATALEINYSLVNYEN